MGLTYKHRKWRDQVRAQYLEATGRESINLDDFKIWLRAHPDHKALFQDG